MLAPEMKIFHRRMTTIEENQHVQLYLKNILNLSKRQKDRYKAKSKSFLRFDGLNTG
jgi:hypothetical protein